MRGCVLRCVWIFICCWFHPVVQRDECIYFFAGIGGSCSLTVMDSLRMFGLSYSSMLMPAWKRNEHKQKKKERKGKEERRKQNQVHHHAPCQFCLMFHKFSHSIYLSTTDAVRHSIRHSRWKMRADDRRPASPPTSTALVPYRTTESIAQPLRVCLHE